MAFLLRTLLIATMLASLACASKIEVQAQPGTDVSHWSSWDWLPGEAVLIHGADWQPAMIENRLVHRVTDGLAERGFDRDRDEPDLYVGVALAGRRTVQLISRTGAVESLSSLHDASFEVQSAELQVETVNWLRLDLAVSERRSGRLIWQGRLTDRISGDGLAALDDAVEALLSELPPRGETPGAGTRLAEATAP